MGPPVGDVTFLDQKEVSWGPPDGGIMFSAGAPVGNVTFLDHGGSVGGPLGDITFLTKEGQ